MFGDASTPPDLASSRPSMPTALRELLLARRFDSKTGTAEVRGLTKQEAEDLLDWLEANGYQHRELNYVTGKGFAVRYKDRPKQ